MYQGRRIAVIAPAFNEEINIGKTVARIPREFADFVLVVDDGSTDATAEVARSQGADVLSMSQRSGVGFALRAALEEVRRREIDIAVIIAGNNKDEPLEIPQLLDPICRDEADLVIGSRYLNGGRWGGDMPVYRRFATRLHPWLMSLFVGKRLTESTNGFRAVRLSCLDDVRINLDQRWLDRYGLEVYLLYKFIRCGFRHTEVPCTKTYPTRGASYTKMRPLLDWWDILRPILFLGCGLKR